MSPDVIIQLLVATGVASVIGAAVNGYINRRKLSAEATQIITQAASGVVARLEVENTRLVARVAALETWQEQAQVNLDNHRMVLQLHAAWDHLAMEHLLAAGDTGLPDAPPLYPPTPKPPPATKDGPHGHRH